MLWMYSHTHTLAWWLVGWSNKLTTNATTLSHHHHHQWPEQNEWVTVIECAFHLNVTRMRGFNDMTLYTCV